MRFWMVFWSLVGLSLGVFVIANWGVLLEQTTLSLVLTRVSAPLGLVLLGAMAALTVLFLVFLVWLETKALVQFRPLTSPDSAQGDKLLAGLRGDIERDLGEFRAETTESFRAVMARLEDLEQVVSSGGRSSDHSPGGPGRL